jgi:UDP-N-acetylglucosamine 2-epimerase (non-hydrolysing)
MRWRKCSGTSRWFFPVFPAHPRTRKALNGRPLASMPNLKLVDPLGYMDFLKLLAHSRMVFTDSGGIQEETTVMGVPCLTLRNNTERPATVEQGTNILAGTDPDSILDAYQKTMANPKTGRIPDLWDGHAAKRVVDTLQKTIAEPPTRW